MISKRVSNQEQHKNSSDYKTVDGFGGIPPSKEKVKLKLICRENINLVVQVVHGYHSSNRSGTVEKQLYVSLLASNAVFYIFSMFVGSMSFL